MARKYKQLATCTMCKNRFVVKNAFRTSRYCPECVKKYFGEKSKEDEQPEKTEKATQ